MNIFNLSLNKLSDFCKFKFRFCPKALNFSTLESSSLVFSLVLLLPPPPSSRFPISRFRIEWILTTSYSGTAGRKRNTVSTDYCPKQSPNRMARSTFPTLQNYWSSCEYIHLSDDNIWPCVLYSVLYITSYLCWWNCLTGFLEIVSTTA